MTLINFKSWPSTSRLCYCHSHYSVDWAVLITVS